MKKILITTLLIIIGFIIYYFYQTINPTFKIIFPTAETTLIEGFTYDITWKNSDVSNIEYIVYLENDDFGGLLIGRVSSSQSKISWTVPDLQGEASASDSIPIGSDGEYVVPTNGYVITFLDTNNRDIKTGLYKQYYSALFKIVPKP